MKTLNEYLNLPYRMKIVEDRDEGGFVVSFPDLPGCITCGETVEAAVENAKDAKRAWLEAALEDGSPIREPISANADKMTARQLRSAIQAGLEDAEAGNVQDASAAFAQFRKQHA